MALTQTTLSAAVAVNDTTVLLASITGLAANQYMRIDNEVLKVLSVPSAATVPVPVLRGQEGSAQVAHPTSARVEFGTGGSATATPDWSQPAAGAPSIAMLPAARPRVIMSYSAAGAITLPAPGTDMVAIINGTGALAMTVAAPVSGNDGDRLTIIGNGKAAHTATFTTGLGAVGATADVATFAAGQQQGIEVMAAGVAWCGLGQVAGAATIAGVGLA